ncbi:MAG: polysaccharide pyruvyl transferase family protein [Propionibacterium sp.]|nr:polysaccharide pyruvyl transferase family protein [Propionibacterium sp.]
MLIETTRLGEYNYGALLQAYALQRAVRDLGGQPCTDESWPVTDVTQFLNRTYGVIRERFPSFARTKRDLKWRALERPRSFVTDKLDTVSIFGWGAKPRRGCRLDYDAYVVGSDQVWRPHSALGSRMLEFVPDDSHGVRLAYGVSFGTDCLSVANETLLRSHQRAVERFNYLSVREDSAVGMCRQLWNVDAVHVVDPVMLYEAADYTALFETDAPKVGIQSGGLLSYVLDPTARKTVLVQSLSEQMKKGLRSILPEDPCSVGEYFEDPTRWAYPSVPQWVSSFARSDAVVTDSYHGLVLALTFERPFVVIGNARRGLARFESLLRTTGLEAQLIRSQEDVGDICLDIDWASVRERIATLRRTSWEFLCRSLAPL